MSEPKKYQYHSRSPQEWDEIDKSRKQRTPSRSFKRGRYILLFNLVLILIIVFVYLATQKQRSIVSESLKTVGNFQIYISANKSEYLSGEPLEFKVYITNLSKETKSFSLYSFNVRIGSKASPDLYNFHFDKTIHSKIEGKSSVLLYDLKHEVNLSYLKSGTYRANILMNLNGKAVHLLKDFTYLSKVQAILESGQDFFVENQKAIFKLYVKDNTPNPVDIKIKTVTFSLLNERRNLILSRTFTAPSQVNLASDQSKLLYTYRINLTQEPGQYHLLAKIQGMKTLSATATFLIVNPSQVGNINDLKLNSDIPMIVERNQPTDFSLWISNTSLKEKFVTLDSITLFIKQGGTELYRFSDTSPHNVIIPSGGTRILVNSKSWRTITFPSSGTYTLNAIVKIKGKYLEYRQIIKSL